MDLLPWSKASSPPNYAGCDCGSDLEFCDSDYDRGFGSNQPSHCRACARAFTGGMAGGLSEMGPPSSLAHFAACRGHARPHV